MTADLTPEQIRDFLREHVTVVEPGETLVIQMGGDYTPNQMREVSDMLNGRYSDMTEPWLPFLVPGDSLGKVTASELENAVRPVVREDLASRTEPRKFEYPVGANAADPGAEPVSDQCE